jgi:hypothetical protein
MTSIEKHLKKKNMLIRILLCFVTIILIFSSCKKENEETLINKQGGPAACDTSNIQYTNNVVAILINNCYECHNRSNGINEAGVNLGIYANVKSLVDNGFIIGVITHAPGYPPMPDGRPKLSDCDINKIKAWINTGAPNN